MNMNLNLNIDLLMQLMPLIIIMSVIQLGLMIAALVHLLRHKNPKTLSVPVWAILIILINLIGPVLYFILGRNENVDDDDEE